MNIKMIRYIIGRLLIAESVLMALPLIVMLVYGEFGQLPSLLIPMAVLAIIGALCVAFKPKDKTLKAKDGFVTVGLSWIVLSLFGCLPFVISGLIPNFVDAFFETVSGFTTTGASVLYAEDFTKLWEPENPLFGMRGIFFWRSFTNWIGGMGVLVFVLAVMPQQDAKSSRLVHVMRAEMPGPKVDKIVSTVKKTSAIMYGIYAALTAALTILLLFGGLDLYGSLCTALATAGTGGFSIWADSLVSFGGGGAAVEYCTWIVAIFMFLFAVNFNVYFLILTGKIVNAIFSEELAWFVGIVLASTGFLTFMGTEHFGNVWDSLRHSFFQVSTIISTSGFATDDFNQWHAASKTLLLILMFIGACAGSTGGGIKVSRLVIAFKSAVSEIRHMGKPREVRRIRFERKPVENDTIKGVLAFIVAYVFIFFASFLIVAIADGQSIETSFSAVAACLNNIGPALDKAGPMSNYDVAFGYVSKIVLAFDMLLGRLEIFPIIMLFSRSVWRDK